MDKDYVTLSLENQQNELQSGLENQKSIAYDIKGVSNESNGTVSE